MSGIPDPTPVDSRRVVDEPLTPMGYEQLTGLSSAKGLTPPTKARFALIVPTGQDVRWRDDGTDPTAAVGVPLQAEDAFWYTGDLVAIKFIEQAASAVVDVSYYSY